MTNTPTLNPDGSLKDASEIEFIDSPSHDNNGILPTAPSSPSPQPNAFLFMQPMGPQHAASLLARKRILSGSNAPSSGNVPAPRGFQKRNDGTSRKAKAKTNKPAAIDQLLSQSSVQSASTSRSASVAPSELSNGGDDSGPEKKCHRKADGPADVLTIFELVDPDDPDEGYRCSGCVYVLLINMCCECS